MGYPKKKPEKYHESDKLHWIETGFNDCYSQFSAEIRRRCKPDKLLQCFRQTSSRKECIEAICKHFEGGLNDGD